jgi:hypothetical protein
MKSNIASTPLTGDHSRMGILQKLSIPLIFFFALLSAFFVYYPITDTDIWWHLAAGRELIRAKAFFHTDPFAYSLDHPQWIDVHWLFQCMVYGIYKVAGLWGIVYVKCAVTALVGILLAAIHADRRIGAITAALYALLIYDARYLVLERPTLVTLLSMALFIVIIERYLRSGTWKTLLWLIPIQIIWTNSQGLFALGFAIVSCYAAGIFVDRVRQSKEASLSKRIRNSLPWPLVIATAILPLISLVNPYGLRGLLFPLRLFGRIDPSVGNIFSRNISENIPLFSLQGIDLHYIYSVAIITGIFLVAFVVIGKKRRAVDLLLAAAFFYLSYRAVRNVLLYYVIISPIVGRMIFIHWKAALSHVKLQMAARWGGFALAVIIFLLVMICAGRTVLVASCFPHGNALSPFRVPTGAVEFMKSHPIEGRLFNADRFGGYCLWELYPPRQVYIDGRFIIRSAPFFKEYLDLCNYPERFDSLARAQGITQAVLPTAIFLMHMPLVKWLYRSNDWALVYTDGASALFYTKSSASTTRPIDLRDAATVGSLRQAVCERWNNDRYIRAENLLYLEYMVGNLTTERP